MNLSELTKSIIQETRNRKVVCVEEQWSTEDGLVSIEGWLDWNNVGSGRLFSVRWQLVGKYLGIW